MILRVCVGTIVCCLLLIFYVELRTISRSRNLKAINAIVHNTMKFSFIFRLLNFALYSINGKLFMATLL